ncbi:MAG: transposase [Elusimicrobia bacterium]|nr:transposase [Elusimicrobiota bacterium]
MGSRQRHLGLLSWGQKPQQPSAHRCFGETFQGGLVSDFHSSYNAKIHGLKQKCLVHLYPDIRESREDHPPPDFTTPEKKIKRLLADAKRLADRNNRFSPLVFLRRAQRIKDRLFHFATDVYSNKTWQRLSARLLKHHHRMLTFLDVFGLPSDNNTAERAIKPHVIVRNRSF